MSPYERMYRTARELDPAQDWGAVVGWHMQHGFVFARPDFFIMGRPVLRYSPESLITEPTYLYKSEFCDCWYVHAMAGNLARAWSVMPWPLPWIAYERVRDGARHLTFRPAEALRRLCPPDIHDESIAHSLA